ncbi:MAG: arsenate reductase-like glutaredoxin family protein [Mariniblastus sp.]
MEALKLVDSVTSLLVAKGKKVVALDLNKDTPSEEEITKLILGPTGNLRAPTLRVGKQLIVGFNEDMYASVFG